MTQFLRDQASDSEEVVIPLMLDGTYLSCSGRDVFLTVHGHLDLKVRTVDEPI